MPDEIAITVSNVSKRYHVYENQRARLRHAFKPKSIVGVSEIWALHDVSFDVKKGSAVGIIGRNGSGKSTLLEIITGTLKPTTGHATVNGRIAALLELGSGFNPDYTGRENVFLNGLLMGLTRADVEASFDDIAGFADIGDVLDRPVKTYSSGMLVRLAFAVQVAVVPDILIVDEALSVGDIFFQQKCFKRINRIRDQGTTILFVSHDMATVRDLCETAVYLCRGEVAYAGMSSESIWRYRQEANETQTGESSASLPTIEIPDDAGSAMPASVYWTRSVEAMPSAPAKLLGMTLLDENGNNVIQVKMGEQLTFVVFVQASSDVMCDFCVEIKNRYGQIVTSNGSHASGMQPALIESSEVARFELKMQCMLEAGQYSFQVSICTVNHGANKGYPADISPWLGPLTITWDYENDRAPFLGMFGVPVSTKFIGRSIIGKEIT